MPVSPYYFYNTELLSNTNKPLIPSHDLLIYEVMRVEQGKPLFINDHLSRLFGGMEKVGHAISLKNKQLKQMVEQLAATSDSGSGNIKIEFYYVKNKTTEVESRLFFVPTNYPKKELYLTGIECAMLQKERLNPSVKASNSPLRNLTDELIKEHVVYEVLLYSSNRFTEGSRSNLFFIKDETIITAPNELVLSGVMRNKVLEVIYQQKLPLKMDALAVEDLSKISAAFITGTSPRVLPIRRIANFEIHPNHFMIGVIRENLQAMINKYISQYKIEM